MLYLTKKQLDGLVEHSKREYPNEACGILAGKNGRVEKAYPMANTDKSAVTFLMEPKEQHKTVKDIRSRGLEMIGIYHSHPSSPARPSPHDIKMAYYPDVSYVIISLKEKDKPDIKSFRIIDGNISEEKVDIE